MPALRGSIRSPKGMRKTQIRGPGAEKPGKSLISSSMPGNTPGLPITNNGYKKGGMVRRKGK